jgi:tape measure domain-containing protein
MATDLERLVVQLSADVRGYENALKKAQGTTNTQAKAIENRFKTMNKNLGSIGQSAAVSLTRPLGAVAAALGIREIVQYADAWTNVRNKLAAAGAQGAELARQQAQVLAIAQATRSDLEPTADLYAKLTRAAGDLGKSQADVAKATEIVNKAFVAGGASTQERIAGVIQLSQALGSGVLQGDELRSIRENAPLLAKAIADAFGTTTAGLKKLGEEGELVSGKVFDAILRGGSDIDKQFGRTTATMADGFVLVKNALTATIGDLDNSLKLSRDLGSALNAVAAILDRIRKGRSGGGGNDATQEETLGEAYAKINAELTAFGKTSETIAGKPIVDAAKIQAVRDLFYQFRDGGPAAIATVKQLEGAVRNLGVTVNGINVADLLDERFAALRALENKTRLPPVDDVDLAGYDAAFKATRDFYNERKRLAGLTKEQIDDEKRLKELRKASKAEGADRLTDAQVQELAALEKAADAQRKAQEKADKASGRPLKPTSESRFTQDLQEIEDRATALRAEAAALGENEIEQEKRRISLEQQQRTLREMQEEARRNRQPIPTALPRDMADQIDAAAEKAARAGSGLDLGRSLETLKQRTIALRDQIEVERLGVAAGRERALMLEAQNEYGRQGKQVDEDRIKAIRAQAQAEADLAYAQQERASTDRIADLQTEIDVLNLGTNATRAQIVAVRELNKARQGGTLTAEREAEIRQRAATEGALQTRIDGINAEREAYQALGQEALSSLQSIISGSDTAGQAMLKLASRIAEAALQAAVLGTGPLAGVLGTAGKGLLSALFAGAGAGAGAGGITAGGTVTGIYADGGKVRGPGTGRSDSIVARLSNGEFVVNASAARRNARLLEMINTNRMPRFANGGTVGGMPRLPSIPNMAGMGAGAPVNNNFRIVVDVTGANGDAAVAAIARQAAAQGAAQAVKVSDQQFRNRINQYQRLGR